MERPRIGIALGSGIGRGWAHIGVMRALHRAGFEPDIVCGTSIGALVGGCYLADKLDPLEDFARSLTKRKMLGLLDLRFGGSGLIGGTKLTRLLEDHLDGLRFRDLDRMFVSIATELATGHEIWLSEGSLVDAIRASYALPGIFKPVHLDMRWLIDGALVNPVPVSTCRAFGARLVIAVNLNHDSFGKASLDGDGSLDFDSVDLQTEAMFRRRSPTQAMMRQLFGTTGNAPGLTQVMLASLNIVQDRLARSRLAGDPPDVMIAPQVGHVGLMDFDRAAEAIRLGEEAAERALPYLEEACAVLAHPYSQPAAQPA